MSFILSQSGASPKNTLSRVVVSILFAATILGTGCASLTPPDRELMVADGLVAQKKYTEAVSAYRTIIKNNSDPEISAEVRFRLAYILISHDNPQPDYPKALQEFEEFLRLYPAHEKAEEAKTWRQALKTIERLNKNIEELKRLDIRHEEKRKRR